jgi:hypothetical protein
VPAKFYRRAKNVHGIGHRAFTISFYLFMTNALLRTVTVAKILHLLRAEYKKASP